MITNRSFLCSLLCRNTCIIGSLIFCTSHAVTYYTIQKSFFWVVFTYGFLSSLGTGLAYVAPLAAGMKWFPKNKGLVNGITVAGYGLGSLIFTQVQTTYLNPLNLSPDADGYFHDETILKRVPSMFQFLFGLYLVIQMIGCAMIFNPPAPPNEIIFDEGRFLLIRSPSEDSGTLVFESAPRNDNDNNAAGYSSCDDGDPLAPRNIDLTYKQAIKTREFTLLW